MRLRHLTMLVPLLIGQLSAQGDFQKGFSYYKQGQYARAAEEFEKIVRDQPTYEAGYRVLGDSYLKLKQYDKSARAFHKAAELDSNQLASFLGAATAEFNAGKYQDAAATLLRAERLAKSPKERYQLFQLRGAAYYNAQRHQEAVADLEKAVAIQRGEYTDLLQLGLAQLNLKNYAKSRQYLEQAVALRPSAEDAKRFLARADYEAALDALSAERYTDAASALEKYVEGQPQEGEAWYNLGLAKLFSRDLAGAEKAFVRSAQLLPSNWEVFNRLGYVYEVTNRYSDSLRSYRKALGLRQDPSIQESVERVQERIRRQNG